MDNNFNMPFSSKTVDTKKLPLTMIVFHPLKIIRTSHWERITPGHFLQNCRRSQKNSTNRDTWKIQNVFSTLKVNVPVLARVPMLARLNAFFEKIRKVVNE